MRLASVLPVALLLAGCGVPSVNFADAGGGGHDATPAGEDGAFDAGGGADAAMDAERDADADGFADASNAADAADAADAPTDAPAYCTGGGSPMPPMGYACCPGNMGEVCNKTPQCNGNACNQCSATAPCTWPNVCCTSGNTGTCKMPPC